jgi:hypothetical protein
MKVRLRAGFIVFPLVFFLLWGCSLLPLETVTSPLPGVSPTFTPFQPLQPSPVPEEPLPISSEEPSVEQEVVEQNQPSLIPPPPVEPTLLVPTPQPSPSIWIDPELPSGLSGRASLPPGYQTADSREAASFRLEPGEGLTVSRWVYVLVAPFPTITDGVGLDRLQGAWRGEDGRPFSGRPLLLDRAGLRALTTLWGPPAPGVFELRQANELLDAAWENKPSWAVVPFEDLDPRWKVLEIEGMSPIQKGFNPESYPLTVSYSLTSEIFEESSLQQAAGYLSLPPSNYILEKKTTLAMTGVTAMVRCTANTMDRFGINHPAGEIGDLLRGADLTHISNEIPFAEGCPPQRCLQDGLIFCSHPKYIELMEYIGTDIVELTGDHFADWGDEAMYFTLEMYRERGWLYYGGGANLEEGRRALLIEHNGNRLAFLGCNGKSLAGYATASDTRPGAVRCDYPWLHAEIARLNGEGYLVISTFQHEEYYRYDVPQNMRQDFLGMAEAGAVIVSGSQAHQPHGMEFLGPAFIHYGLGNLFFDQWGFCPGRACDYAFIDVHVFYDGRHISTDLVPLEFVDYARTRFMTPEEKERFLNIIFSASGW